MEDRRMICPYFQNFGSCCRAGKPYSMWHNAETGEDKMKYAREFLGQLKSLK